MRTTLDTPETLAALHRINAIARARKLALHEIRFEAREASSLEAFRAELDRVLDYLETVERDLVSKA